MPTDRSTASAADDGTIVIVSNRGPHDLVWENQQWVSKPATGGLVGMIEPLARQPNVAWFCCVSEPAGSELGRDALFTTAKDQIDPDLNVVPVPLPAHIYQDYYGQISNEILWILQHHLMGQFGYAALDEGRHRAWGNYLEANRRLADAVAATEIPVRAFYLQDYHLYPLAALLRQRYPDTPSLHFIHLPFPGPDLLKLLPKPWRETILRGLLGADIVGLQTPSDVRSFLACCEEMLGASVDHEERTVVEGGGRTVRVRAFPASTSPAGVRALQESSEVAAARQRILTDLGSTNIVRVDPLDPSKNQILGFSAFGRLLEMKPDLRGKVRFLAFLIPSRTDLTIYRDYHHAVYREISRINARFRESCGSDPIVVYYTNDRALAFAAMEACDVFLANVRQDGMNVTVKEWALISRKPGALVLSETSGVAAEFSAQAFLVCPFDVEGTAQALAAALAMPAVERSRWLEPMRAGIEEWAASHWLEAQMRDLGVHFNPAHRREQGIGSTTAALAGPQVVERELTVQNRQGVHARPAALFVRCAREFDCHLEIVKGLERFSAKSILEVLTANLSAGSTFLLRASGAQAEEAVQKLAALVASFPESETIE